MTVISPAEAVVTAFAALLTKKDLYPLLLKLVKQAAVNAPFTCYLSDSTCLFVVLDMHCVCVLIRKLSWGGG